MDDLSAEKWAERFADTFVLNEAQRKYLQLEFVAYRRAVVEACRKVSRSAITKHLALDTDQRAYSWHDIQDALEAAAQAIVGMGEEK